ncbi:MAG TPA: iron ABC transporter permease [Acidimicrobiales bacterium]|nr:iron ABC transporter permease [Acidimicrobiales bacterium]
MASTDELTPAPVPPSAGAIPAARVPGSAPLALRVVCGVVGLLFAAPLGYLAWRTLTGDESLASLYTSGTTLVPLRNTLVLAATTAASTAVVGTALAWLTTRTDLPLRRLWAVLAALPLVFPSFVGALALLAAVGPGGLLDGPLGWVGVSPSRPEGFAGAWLVLTLFTTPYVLLPVSARLAALPPSLEESARLLGRRPAAVFATVVWPQVRGAVGAGSLLVFLYALSDFGVVVLLRYDTLTRVIYTNRALDRDRSVALSLLLAVLALAVVAGERTLARRHPPVEGVRGRRSLQVPLGHWRWPAVALVAAWVAVALGGPLASLGLWAWRGFTGEGSSLASGSGGLGDLVEPAANTVGIGLVTAVVAVAVVLPLAYLSARHRARAGDVATGLVASGFALPGLVIALAVVFWSVQLPPGWGLYQSFVMLVFAYVVHLGVQSLRAAQVAVGSVPRRLDESARMLGAGRARRFATVDLPLMVPGLAAGGGLVLLSTMKELPITLLTAPTGFETLATRIWADAEAVFLAEAALASVVLVALSGALTWLLVVRRSDRLA